MSARITIHCNTQWQYGTCTAQLSTDAATIAEARDAASRLGWRTHPAGRDYCPACSGQPPRPTNVVHLRPDTTTTIEES
jgi:hypothetical protein